MVSYDTITASMPSQPQKAGVVVLIGRPNAGKSTLLNNILGQKVSITSPKPQTTRFNIQAVYNDERGQIIFVDTPGIFAKVKDALAKRINIKAERVLSKGVDLIVYVLDHTRSRDLEENKTLGIVRKASVPKILIINKIDIKKPSYLVQYKFMEEEFATTVEVSASTGKNVPLLLETIFALLPEGKPILEISDLPQPGLNLDSKTFIAEIIREKAFIFLRREVPYTLTTVVDEIVQRPNSNLYIRARILTSADRYKAMIVGHKGKMIKEISMAARKELERASNRKVFIDLSVETDPHWMEYA